MWAIFTYRISEKTPNLHDLNKENSYTYTEILHMTQEQDTLFSAAIGTL